MMKERTNEQANIFAIIRLIRVWYRRCLGQNKQSVLVGVGAKNTYIYIWIDRYECEGGEWRRYSSSIPNK